MNAARIFTLADFIEDHQPGLGFNMGNWLVDADDNCYSDGNGSVYPDKSGHNCGTIACIAGHEAVRNRMEETGLKRVFSILRDRVWYRENDEYASAQKSLDLTLVEAQALFTPWDAAAGWPWGAESNDVTSAMAARVLRYFAITGKVDWSVAFQPVAPEIEAELFRLSEANRAKVPANA